MKPDPTPKKHGSLLAGTALGTTETTTTEQARDAAIAELAHEKAELQKLEARWSKEDAGAETEHNAAAKVAHAAKTGNATAAAALKKHLAKEAGHREEGTGLKLAIEDAKNTRIPAAEQKLEAAERDHRNAGLAANWSQLAGIMRELRPHAEAMVGVYVKGYRKLKDMQSERQLTAQQAESLKPHIRQLLAEFVEPLKPLASSDQGVARLLYELRDVETLEKRFEEGRGPAFAERAPQPKRPAAPPPPPSQTIKEGFVLPQRPHREPQGGGIDYDPATGARIRPAEEDAS